MRQRQSQDRLSNTEKDKGKPALSFSLILVIKKPIHSLSFNCGNQKVLKDAQKIGYEVN